MVKKQLFLVLFGLAIILFSFSMVSAENYKLLCLDKGQKVYFSRCNSAMQDKTCTSDTGCQYCVSVTNSNIYCPANVNICNTQGFSCTSDSPAPAVNNSPTTSGVQLNLTQITINPTLPLSNDGKQKDITISFKSNIYPFTAIVKIYETSGSLISSTSPALIERLSQSQITYTIPAGLSDGNHLLTLTGTTSQQSTKTINLGIIVVKKPVSTPTTTNSSASTSSTSSSTSTQSTSTTSTSSSSQSQSSSTSSTSSSNQDLNSNSNSHISVSSSSSSNPYSNSLNNSDEQKINSSNQIQNLTKGITGAAIGTITTGKLTIVLIIIMAIVLAYSFIKKKRSQNPTSEFTF